jgi:hypothetical protein
VIAEQMLENVLRDEPTGGILRVEKIEFRMGAPN